MDLEEGLLGGAACGPVAPIVARQGALTIYVSTTPLRKLIRKACAVTMMVVSHRSIEGAFKLYRILEAEKSVNISALIAIYICKA